MKDINEVASEAGLAPLTMSRKEMECCIKTLDTADLKAKQELHPRIKELFKLELQGE